MIQLRDYQKTLIEQALLHKEGVISASTGSGKTLIFLEIIFRLKLTATILSPNTTIMQQIAEECRNFYNYDCGLIYAKEKNIKGITVATFQSLFDNADLLRQLADHTSILIIDEAHGCVSRERRKVIEAFRPKYLYGATGSAFRDDGQTEAIFFLLGPIIGSYQGKFYKPEIEFVESDAQIPLDDYHAMVTKQIANDSRNALIAGLALGEALSGRKVLILTKRVEHAKTLANRLKMAFLADSSDKERNSMLAKFKKEPDSFGILIGTTSLLSVGVDIPSLDSLILACDLRGEVLTTQSAGRIMRLFEGKPTPKIIDIVDGRNTVFRRQALARLAIYKKNDWPIVKLPYSLTKKWRPTWQDILPNEEFGAEEIRTPSSML